jgi:minimal PKS acyl carrier protein
MPEPTLEDLKVIMRRCVGADEDVDLDGDIGDRPFAELGYDSLAVLEMVGQVQEAWHVSIPDEAVDDLATPAAVLDYVRQQRSEVTR